MSDDLTRPGGGDAEWGARARPKRFYKTAVAIPDGDGGAFTVTLDGKPIRAPGGAPFRAPEPVAQAAAAEWEAVTDVIDPMAMPVTRAVNTALEQIPPQRAAVIDEIAGYGEADLICYRASAPAALVAREAAAWDPFLSLSAEQYGARLLTAEGVVHAAQPPAALAALRMAVAARSDIGLAALSELTALSGSVVIGLAVSDGHWDGDAAWAASRVDEIYQAEQWGADAEAERAAAIKGAAFAAAARLAALDRGGPRERSVEDGCDG